MALTFRHRWLKLVPLMLCVPAAGYAAWQAPVIEGWFVERTRDAGFVLSSLSIEGMERSRRSEVLAALDVDDGMPLLAIDLGQMQKQLEALPWVKRAEVTRVLPGELHIRLTERHAYALWQDKGRVYVIDADGTVITTRGVKEFAHLMLVVGDGAQGRVHALQTMLDETPELAAKVRTAVRVGERRWDLIFDNGIRVKLPEDDQVPYGAQAAWSRFVEYENKHRLLEREVMVIDMRLPDRMVLRVSPDGHKRMEADESLT
ncbi:MAG: FtsQ-type POTRA domain-containing protein [Alphaproteobacteria bacterium]|nr:MAG: FtsQ-type POTRA domain-containing protein [Alphaproteobacteria bacterium]